MNLSSWLLTTLSASTAVLAVGWGSATVLRRHAAWESAIWRTVFLLLLALPLVSLARGRTPSPSWQPVKSASLAIDQWAWKNIGPVLAKPMLPASVSTMGIQEAADLPDMQKRVAGLSLLYGLFLVWGAGAILGVCRLVVGVSRVRGLVRNSRPFARLESEALLADCARTANVRRPALRRSKAVSSPLLAGWLRPCILVPEVGDLPSREVLLHELAHLRRRDLWWMTLAHVVGALWWFHPLVWKVAHRMERSAENVCDDLVIRWAGDAAGYATQLLAFARLGRSSRGLGLAGVAVTGFRSGLGQRIARLLAPGHRAQVTIGRGGAALLAAGTVSVLGLILAVTPGRGSEEPPANNGPGAPGKSTVDPGQTIRDFHVTSTFTDEKGNPPDLLPASEVIDMSDLRKGTNYDEARGREAVRRLFLTGRFEFVRVYGKPAAGGGWNVEIAYTPKFAPAGKKPAAGQVPGPAGEDGALAVVAMVNRAPILSGNVESLVAPRLRSLVATLKGAELDKQASAARETALGDLIDRELILQEFMNRGFTVPEELVDGRLATIAREEFGGDYAAFIKVLATQNYTESEFRRAEQDKIAVQAMRFQALAKPEMPPGREQSFYTEERQRRQEVWLKGLRDKAEIKILAKS